ncbi:MAG: M20/M25/M40 family metallo-hydrolase [candidate division SR1 bacterium]|nr:M20/M25/M40 family metallo-hydrolase [candidate division SR1 bacterium]
MLAQYYRILKDIITYKTVSSQSDSSSEMQAMSQYLAKLFSDNDCEVEIVMGYGNPVVLASYMHNPKLPTCLFYGHYDVQSANKEDGWKYDPFSLHLGKEKIYGRGVADDKGQFLIHLLTIFDLIQNKNLCYNIVCIIEGDEEIGSSHFPRFLTDYKNKIQADCCLISDSLLQGDFPCLDAGYRGGINLTLQLTTADTDLHSGVYGGIVPNAVHELTKIISQLYDMNHRITIPYFYYDVEDIESHIMVKHRKLHFDTEGFLQTTGVHSLVKDKEFDVYSQLGLRPTIQVTGIEGGHAGEGFMNAIPHMATAHINFRLVKNQSTQKVLSSFEQRLKVIVPPYADYELIVSQTLEPVKVSIMTPFVKKAERILEALYDQKVHYAYAGSSLPIVSLLHHELQLPCVLVPLANKDANIHGVNENFDIALIEKGFQFSHAFFAAI